ncbi:MAG: response regulator [Thermoplasmata archaeon]
MNSVDEEKNRVLVVDDDKDLREMLVTLINTSKKLDAKATAVSSGGEALRMLKDNEFDLVLADHRMKGISGIKLLTKIKKKYPNIIRILITGYSDLTTAKEAINKAKVHHYLEKPCSNEEIVSTIYMELNRLEEMKTTEVVKVQRMVEAIDILEKFKQNLSSISKYHAGIVSLSPNKKEGRHNLMFEFDSSSEFNKFSFELRDNEDLQKHYQPRIEDMRIFENRYLVTISIKP